MKHIYERIIKSCTTECINPFKMPQESSLFCDICRKIRSCSIFLADISEFSLNVAFELGFAVGLGKPVVLLAGAIPWTVQPGLFKLIPNQFIRLYQRNDEVPSIIDDVSSHQPSILLELLRGDFPEPSCAPANYFHNRVILAYSDFINDCIEEHLVMYDLPTKVKLSNIEDTVALPLYECTSNVLTSASTVIALGHAHVSAYHQYSASLAFYAGVALASEKPFLLLVHDDTEEYFSDISGFSKAWVSDTELIQHIATWMDGVFELIESRMAAIRAAPGEKSAFYEFDIGSSSAETDYMPESCFVVSESIRQIMKGNCFLVIGRRGVGKSATIRHLRDHARQSADEVVIPFIPPYNLMEGLLDVVQKADLGKNPTYVFHSYWEEVFAYLGIAAVVSWEKPGPDYLMLQAECKAFLTSSNVNPYDYAELCGTTLERYLSLEHREPLYFEVLKARNAGAVELLRRILDSVETWFVVDEIDKVWNVNSARNAAILFKSLMRYLLSIRSTSKVTVFLRQDAYDLLSHTLEDMQQIDIMEIKWSLEELSALIAIRIMAHFEISRGKDDRAAWNRIFESTKEFDCRSFVLERCLGRPRYLLTLVREAISTARRKRVEVVRQRDLTRAFDSYVRRLSLELESELENHIPNVIEVLQGLRGIDKTNDLTLRGIIAREAKKLDASPVIHALEAYGLIEREGPVIHIDKAISGVY
jgi:hypothetical protein